MIDPTHEADSPLEQGDSSANFYADLAKASDQSDVLPQEPKQPDTPMPSWVRDYLEGLDHEEERRQMKELEAKLPGISNVFEELLDSLPDSHDKTNPEFPVSAYVVRKGESGRVEIVARVQNRTNAHNDSTAHAEMEALREAQEALGDKHLDDCFLLSSLEPCVMCCGGIENTNIAGVLYGAKHEDVEGKHALVGGDYKPYRTSPDTFDAEAYLKSDPDRYVWAGFMRRQAVQKLYRGGGNWAEYYRDPDTK